MGRGAWRAAVHGVAQSRTRPSEHSDTSRCVFGPEGLALTLPAHSSQQGGSPLCQGAHPCRARWGCLWTRAGGRGRCTHGGGTDPPAPPGRADSGAEPLGRASQRRATSVPPEPGGSSGHGCVSAPPSQSPLPNPEPHERQPTSPPWVTCTSLRTPVLSTCLHGQLGRPLSGTTLWPSS